MSLDLFLQGPLVRWLKVNFSEAFIAWIHIKALRVFVESVLRCSLQITQPFPATMQKLIPSQLFEGLLFALLQIWAASELPGHAPATKQEDHEEAEGGAERPLQTSGQQRSSHYWCKNSFSTDEAFFSRQFFYLMSVHFI